VTKDEKSKVVEAATSFALSEIDVAVIAESIEERVSVKFFLKKSGPRWSWLRMMGALGRSVPKGVV